MQIASIDLKVVKEPFFEIPIKSLMGVGEFLLCDYAILVDYILEINLSKRKKDLRMIFNGPI